MLEAACDRLHKDGRAAFGRQSTFAETIMG